MIKTKNTVSYDPVDLTKTAVVYAQPTRTVRNDQNETYTIQVTEWIEIPYEEEINGEVQQFTSRQTVRTMQRTMTFAEADQLTAVVDQLFAPQQTGSSLRKEYTRLGHLIVNNNENVRNVAWELV
jgi:hypothetical protein